MTALRLRNVAGHAQAQDAYRVVYDGIEIGSIGKQQGAQQRVFWLWAVDTVLPRQSFATRGEGRDREDCMAQFKATWDVFISEPARLASFMEAKRSRPAGLKAKGK
jgi:hypothetical protein